MGLVRAAPRPVVRDGQRVVGHAVAFGPHPRGAVGGDGPGAPRRGDGRRHAPTRRYRPQVAHRSPHHGEPGRVEVCICRVHFGTSPGATDRDQGEHYDSGRNLGSHSTGTTSGWASTGRSPTAGSSAASAGGVSRASTWTTQSALPTLGRSGPSTSDCWPTSGRANSTPWLSGTPTGCTVSLAN